MAKRRFIRDFQRMILVQCVGLFTLKHSCIFPVFGLVEETHWMLGYCCRMICDGWCMANANNFANLHLTVLSVSIAVLRLTLCCEVAMECVQ